MTSQSRVLKRRRRKHRDRADYGFARVRDIAFDAVQSLWRRRRSEGMKQVDIARSLEREPAWVNRSLRGPGNWTLRTFGEMVEALNGEIEITVHAMEDPLPLQDPLGISHLSAAYPALQVANLPMGTTRLPVGMQVDPLAYTGMNVWGEETWRSSANQVVALHRELAKYKQERDMWRNRCELLQNAMLSFLPGTQEPQRIKPIPAISPIPIVGVQAQ